jgi:hypothetical protein
MLFALISQENFSNRTKIRALEINGSADRSIDRVGIVCRLSQADHRVVEQESQSIRRASSQRRA